MRLNRGLSLILACSIILSGCGAVIMHPGAANKFDSQAYDILYVGHNTIETTKAQLAANTYTPAVAAIVKTALNNLILTYNIADTAYQAYHTAAVAGTSTTAQQNDVQTKLNAVSSSVTALASVKAPQ